MALSSAFLDEVRARTVMSALVGQAVKLVKRGREMAGCCPFHAEKTPSFYVNDDKGFAHCFGCGAHVDAISWLVQHDGLEFIEAVRALADAAGLVMPERTPEAAQRAARIDGVRPALEAAAAMWRRELEVTGAAREHLAARGIDDATAARFGMGWAPMRSGGIRALGISLDTAVLAGLAWVDEAQGRSGERFNGRLMVPVHDARGRVVGFGGRSLQPSTMVPKYMNSPKSEIFDKGRLLFNYHRAFEFLRAVRASRPTPSPSAGAGGVGAGATPGEHGSLRSPANAKGAPGTAGQKRLIIVEGYFDVIALDAVGIGEVVAPMGTALTPAHLERAWRMVQCPLLMFDGDAAGQAAAVRACETALPLIGPGRGLAMVVLPEGEDPDDIAGKGGGAAIEALIDGAVGMAAFLFDEAAGDLSRRQADAVGADARRPSDPDAVAAVWHRLEALAGTITDPETRGQYVAAWRARFDSELSLAARVMPRVADVAALRPADDVELADGTVATPDYAFPDGPDESRRKLKMLTDRLLTLRGARADINDDIKSVLAVAKAMGFIASEINHVVRELEMDASMRMEREAVRVSYRRALGVVGPLTDALLPAITGERLHKAVQVADKRLSRTLAYLDAPVAPSAQVAG